MTPPHRHPVLSQKMIVWPLLLSALVVSALLLTATTPSRPIAQADQPNIIFILTDDLEDHPTILELMPNLQRLMVDGGMRFQNAVVPMSLCCPSRVSIFTGQYAHNHDIVKNAPPDGGFAKVWQQEVEKTMFAPLLQRAGYTTALMGKYMNGYPLATDPTYVPEGWNEWYASKGGVNYMNYTLIENGSAVDYGHEESDYLTDVLAAKAVDFLQRQHNVAPGKPFFLELSLYAPHGPALPAPRHAALFPDLIAPRGPSFNEADISDKPPRLQFPPLSAAEIDDIDQFYRDRVRSMQAVDDLVGELFATLATTGELDNTYLFFTSDNGYHQGEHRIAHGKQSPYEESVRLPFLVVGPGVSAGSERMEVVSTVDLAPTFLDLAGLPTATASTMDGRSLRPLLESSKPLANWRTAVLFEKIGVSEDPLDPQDLALRDRVAPDDTDSTVSIAVSVAPNVTKLANLPRFRGLRTERYSFIRYGDGVVEFYDLWADPFQIENIAESAPPAMISIFETELAALVACQGDSCRTAGTFALPAQPVITATPTATGAATATRLPTGTPRPTATATNTATATATATTVSGVGTPEPTPSRQSDNPEQLYLPMVIK
ncbi:MAG: sulfatase [Caldilineaceae bacterium]|nr:sulfatase [Caldilineaceae bacterium]